MFLFFRLIKGFQVCLIQFDKLIGFLRILVIVPSYKPAYIYGGPIRSIAALCEALVSEGHDVTVFTTNANGNYDLDVSCEREFFVDGVRVYYFKRVTRGHSNLSPALLKALQRECSNYDIVHIQSWWNLVSMPAAWLCLMNGIRPILSPRGTLTTYTYNHNRGFAKRALHALVGKKLLAKSVLICSSEREKEEAKKFTNNRDVFVVPNLLDLPEERHGSYNESDFLRLIFLGRIDPAKNLEIVLNALQSGISIPYTLTLVGEGDPAYTAKLKEVTSQNHNIIWQGAVDGNEKYKLLAESDVLILPSHTENYGNVVFEALSQGTPVMVSGNVGAKDYILQNNLGRVIEGDENEWNEAIEQFYKDKDLRRDMRISASACIARDYNGKNMVQDYVDIYRGHLQPVTQQ